MASKNTFNPRELKALGVSDHPMLGRAIEIMLKAVGFKVVEVSTLADADKKVNKLDPHIILFTEDYLKNEDKEHLENWCGDRQTVILLKQQNAENVFQSQEWGFDSIVFADTSLEKMHGILEKVYLRYHKI